MITQNIRKTTQENYAEAEEVAFVEVTSAVPVVPAKPLPPPVATPPSLARRFANDLKKRIQPVYFFDLLEVVFALVDAVFRLLYSVVVLFLWWLVSLLVSLRELADKPRGASQEPPPPTANNDQQSTASSGITINQQFNINNK